MLIAFQEETGQCCFETLLSIFVSVEQVSVVSLGMKTWCEARVFGVFILIHKLGTGLKHASNRRDSYSTARTEP